MTGLASMRASYERSSANSRSWLGMVLCIACLLACRSQSAPRNDDASRAIREIRVYDELVCALRADGSVWCWGDSPVLSRFAPSPSDGREPTPLPALFGARDLFVGHAGVCVVPASGGLRCVGDPTLEEFALALGRALPANGSPDHVIIEMDYACAIHAGDILCTSGGPGSRGGWWLGTARDQEVPSGVARVQGVPPVAHLVGDQFGICALTREREVWCWSRRVRTAVTGHRPLKEPFTPARFRTLVPDGRMQLSSQLLALQEGDTLAVYALFGGGEDRVPLPEDASAVRIIEGEGADGFLVYAATERGRVVVMDRDSEPVRVSVLGDDVTQLAGGRGAGLEPLLCALTRASRVYCWQGRHVPGEDASTPEHPGPSDAPGYLGWKSLPASAPPPAPAPAP